uniref:Dystonin n=1 Tax=Geospiza parvula TaxID=87175 RepID=A0A8U8CK90_GEOPR
MIAAAFLVLLRPYSIQCALFLLLLLLGTIATILFFCCWHRRLQKGRHPIKSVFSGRSRSRGKRRCRSLRAGFRSSPRHARRRVAPRLEETQPIVEAHHLSEQETSVRKRKIKKSSRVQPEFYHSVQVTPTRKPSSGNASYRCSMSSSADFSDEEDFSQRSGTVSPAPGDTLPWNLPKHERSKRKIQGGSVLDPAERAVLRIADERDKVQKKTFTKWINQHLMKVRKHVNDLYEDLRDGHNLISLLEVLSGDTLPRERDFLKTLRLVSSTEACANEQHEDVEDEDKGPREKGRMRFHRLQNVQIALDYLKKRQVKLVNIRNDDITDGNPKLTLGLIWTIILHFQISDIHVTGESEDMSAKERLLLWSQQTTEGYAGIRCENFTTCWRDGRLFNAIIHKYRPDLIDMNTVAVQSNLANLEHAFFVAEKLGVARLLDPEDVDVSSPDEKSVITYVSSLYDAFPKVPEGGEGISANDVEVKWVEYQNMVNYLMQWIRHHVTIMSDRTFPNNPVELKALYNQYLQFKETEIPPKETDKSKIKHLYKLLEVWIEFGRIKLSQGYHPNDIEKEWGKLIIAMLEREKTLRPEVERLEMLQQIANRIQRDSRSCEDKLILARNALQSDTKRLESGLQFQHEAEIAGYLLESENLLRQQVIDAQILIDGKYYQADQLVQRVAKLRDDLMALRTECSSVYSKGHALTTEQTKLMISGITESLNSGFTANLTPELNAAMTQGLTPTLTSGLSSGLSSRLTPTVTPAYPSGIPPRLIQSYVTGVDSGTLQTLKLMQIRKPLMKSAFVDQNLTEEEVNMKFVQDLLSWVEEMQVQLDRAEWGSDLPSVESHLENHKNVHKAIEEFESSLKEAKISEIQMTAPLKLSYAEKLHKLESQYSKLLNTSRNQERHLDTLHNFVSRATRELIWLNEKEEEEVAYDWSERNPNITRKKEYHAELMRELDEKEEVIKSVQEIAEQLLLENHPARLTIEAYRAAMQTQWSWILQLCHCVEQHLRENAAYFEFFSDAKEAMEYLKNLKDTIYRKYSCDRSSSLHRLEDLVQESMEEKEQLLQYKSTVAGLVGRAKAIIQLKPRNPDCILKTSIPIKAICDYRQIEITIYKDDECVLANNSHRAKWKVISPSGNEAMVPSVCFTVPPPNKEAIDTANRIEQQFQNVLALWHESHVNMKSVVSWHYLTNEIEVVRAGNVASIKTMLPGEHQQVLSNLQSRFDDFVEDSQESKIFTSSDTAQLEREVNVCKQYYQELLKSAEREEQEESIYNLYISEVRNIRLRLESCEERLIRQIRTPMERDDVHENVLRISEQEKLKKELDRLKDDLGVITDKCEEFFSQAAGSPSVPTLRSELNVVIQNMNQVYSMSSIFIDKLKTINLVLTNTQTAESLVKHYETKLCEEEAVTADKSNIENLMGTLKQWRSEVDEKRQTFHALEDELQKAKMISDQMFKMHKERDLDFDWHKEKVDQLAERWQNVHSQIENRLRDLEGINKSLKYYKDTYNSLDTWIQQMEDTQRKIQEVHPENSKALAKQLNQHKMLVSEIEMKQSKIDECQKYSEQYSAAVKDYELQTMTYRAMVDSQQKSPVKRRRIQSSSDFIIQEFMDLRTRYTALVTLMTQYIKFAGDSLKRLEEEEKSMEEEKKEHVEKAGDLLKWVSNLSKTLSKEEGEKAEKTDLPKQSLPTTYKLSRDLLLPFFFHDRMSDEERHEMEKQVRSLQESYSLLSNEALKQLQEAHLGDEKIEEKVNKVIAGVIDQTTGEVLSVFQSILRGFLDYDTGIRLLENQLILSGIISPELGVCYDLEEAKAHALIDEQILLQLQELSNAKKLMSESSLANIPVISALEQGLISEPLAVKILENQLSSGYLILPSTGEKLSLQNTFQRNLISPTLYSKLLERQDTCKDLIDPNCAEKISLEQMVHRSIVHEATGLRLLPVKPQEKGRIVLKCGRKVTILRAAHEGLIDRETMFRLLGAQLMSGGIIDPDSGKRMTVEEAMRQGMIDQDTACGILTRQAQTGGILCQNSGQRLTVDEAVQCNLISATSALLVLEAQRGFVGLIWPHTGEIFPVSTSLHQDMITNELAFKILNDRKKIAALYIPETCEIISLDKAAESGIIDSNTVSVLTNVTLPDKMPNVEELKSLCKSAAKWLSTYEFLPSVFRGCEGEHEVSGTEDPVCHNLDEAKKLFMSYLMVNSYMDANTGQRLLLYDGQLEEIINILLEGDSAGYNAGVSEIQFSNKYVSSKGIHLKSTNSVQGDLSGAENSLNCQNTNKSSNGSEISPPKPDALGSIEDAKELGDGSEVQPTGRHTHTTDVSSAILSSMGTKLNYGAQNKHEMLKNTKGENVMVSDTSSLGNGFKKQMSMESLQKEMGPCKDFQVKEGISQSAGVSDALMEDLQNILQRKLKMGQVYCKQESEPLSYSDTRTLMQNLLKMVRSTQLESEMSSGSNLKQISNAVRTALMVTTLSAEPKDSDAPSLLWPDCRSPDLLHDILKHESCKQNTADSDERKSKTDMKAPVPKLTTNELLEIFRISLGDESTSKLEELINGLLRSSQVAGAATEHEGKGKGDGLYSLSSTEQSDLGGEIDEEKTLADNRTTTWKSDQENFIIYFQVSLENLIFKTHFQFDGVQQCLKLTEKMQEHLAVLQDMKNHLDKQQPISNSLEILKAELEQLESFESGLATFPVILKKDMKMAEELLKSCNRDVPGEKLKELNRSYDSLQEAFLEVCDRSSKRAKQIVCAVDLEMSKLAGLHQQLLNQLQRFSDWITDKNKIMNDFTVNTNDIEEMKKSLQLLKVKLSCKKMQLESTAFDVQFFISEHAEDLSPNQSKQLLRLLNTTQKSFQEAQEAITSQVESLETQLQAVQELGDQKDVAERQQECKEKLQEICDLLTQTENRLIGQRQSLGIGDSKAELEQYQTKQEEIQKDMRTSAQTLAEIVKNTEAFLKENGEKLSQEDKTILEQKLNEAKTKCLLLSQKAEESKKELDKAMTTAIKQETEKVAAIEQLEESKNTIENLLDWLSNVDKEAEHGRKFKQVIEQNGTHFEEGDVKVLEGEEDDVNGNLLEMQQDIETQVDGLVKSIDDNLNQQYQKVKAQHEKIISQQQAIIVATQSAQALLEKQGHYLTPEEKDKMQRNMKELKAQYETALAESERKMKLTHSLREELEKFDADYSEFETWLQQAEQELDNLEAGASDFSGIMVKLKRQKSFSEDVISHKGDLRYITISGQRVLDAARSCSKRDGVKVDKDGIDTSATYAEVQNKLDRASDRFKSLYTKCSILGNNLKDLVDKYQHYEDASSGLLSGLQASEIAVNKQLSEPIAVDPKNLQRQLEETKVLQGQVSNHQIAVEKLKKAAEVLLDTRGELTPDKDEIQKTLDDIVERYDNLSKSVNERNEKLQVTLTRSLSVQDGLDEMLDWMEGVEKSLKEQDQVPLNSAAIQDIISKSIMLEQDIAGRQSSINTMNEKVKKFMETADPSTASTLQAKMSELAGRFSEASNKHREKLMKMEELKTKVELFEGLSTKLQSFLDEKNRALSETEAPRKDVSEVSQYMYVLKCNPILQEDLEVLKQLLEELSFHALPGDKALVSEKVNALSKKFKEVEETIKEKEEDVSSCQKQMDAFEFLVESLKKWIKETTERIPAARPSLNTEELKKPLEDTLVRLYEWTLKAPELQKMNSRGTLLCNLITAVTSPAKLRAVAKSGGTILNGEGGAPGTQDFLKNKELTTVQQAMSNVNHSYEDLGVLLNEKISELESMLSKMQNIQEESASMMHWLQKMDKTASDWEAAPTDSEAVKAQVEQHKLFETELKQSANKVQELKDKVTELLEKNPNSPEAPKWRQTLDKIDSKWKELNQVTSERQQKLEESSNYLIQFQTAEAQLKHWLVEKELMVSVLGPLSIDPNMLNTQKQQVQILLKEFDTRKPQYEQLTMAGQGILERPGEHPPSHEIVKEQLAAVAQKWDSLTSQLKKRCDRIDQAIVKSTEYQSLLRSLSDKLSALDNKLSSSLAVSTQPDAVKQQLEIAKEMKEEIEQEMKNINAAQALCEELSTLVGEEYLKAELTRQLDGILKSFKDIEQKSDNHVQQLQSAYTTSHQFQQMSKDFAAWLSKKKEELSQARPVSAKLEALQSLIEEQKDFKKTMTDQISSYERIVAEGESILQKTQGDDKAELQSQIATLKNDWDEMNKKVKEREDKLADCLEKALKYKQHVENLQPWIEKCQSNLCELKVGINPVEIEDSIVQVRAWQKDLDKHHGMVELLNNSAESLLNASQTDKEIIQEETKVLNQNVKVVTEQLHKKRECLENMAQRLKEFQDSSRETERQLKSAKEHLEAHDSLGPQSFSNKHLTMMQAQQKALQALKPHVDLAKKLAQDLVVEASDSAGVSDLLLQAESLEQEYTAVKQQVEDRCSFLETKLQGIGHFQNSIREMFSQFAEFDDELDSMAPVGRDLKVLQSQREDIKCFMKKLEDLIINNENANKNCKIMLATEAEASPDLVGIKRDLEALNKQCNKLKDRAKAREDQVEGTICRVEEFYTKLKEFSTLLGRAEEHEESQGPVGMETEAINQQLDTFKVFQKEEIEPLQVKQQEVNWLGQGLIQSAAKSTSTENLEHDLEDVNTRWKTLNKKVAQRAAQLQEALLHCGRFQDALESLLSWLIDTEDLVANQKPPSAEFKVVKAQIQEQKLLQRLLDDRKPTVEAIKREGEKIAESAEPADRVKILKQLSFLDSRWDALLSKAETRNRQLEGISVVAQQFHEALEPLVEWLTATEKRLANAEPIGTQASKLQQQIAQHKALEDDVLAHNKSLHQAISAGQSLKTMSSREDKDMVQEKLDSAQARYIEIQEKSNSRSELLQQAYSNAQIFGEDEVELMNWLNEIHDKLNKLSVQDCNTELLEKQHSELLDLQEEILLRKQNVDLAIQNGLELLKQTTGDEVVIVQDKLEGIKARYKDITKLSSDVSKTLEQALQLAGQLHSTHEELCKWLDEVEMELLSYETQIPKGEELSQVQERQKELKKEAKNNKGLVDTLNEVGSAFLELVPWRAREGLDKMITEDNERYRLVSDTISQKVDEIDAAFLRSQQFDQAADAEFAWIAETEKKLMSLGDIRLEQDQTTAQLQVQKAFTMEILRHKDTIDELVKSGDKIMKTCTEEEKQMMKKKIENLLQKYDQVCQMNSERNLQLERAQSLVNQFWETYEELWPWLTETEMIISQLPAPALEYETLKQQQEEHRQLRELIAEHKPHIDKMNKTGPQLLELSPGEGFSIQEKYVAADTLYSKIKEDVKKRALALDEAISQCTQFHDKIDPTLESLKRIVERLRQPPSISAEVEKIKEQISENKNVSVDLEKLQPVYETLKQRGEEMIARSEGADKDVSAKAVQDKLDQMVLIWEDIQTLTEEREAKLLDVMELAEKFWCDHMALVATIKDTQDFIRELEGPGVDPSVVKQQQEAAEAAKEEIDGLQEELEAVVSLGSELRAACGEPDKPIVNKSIDELNSAWDALNKTWKERVDKLGEAMQAAVQYQDGLQALFDWVDIAGSKLASMSPVGTDLETVKQQTEELKQFKTEAYQQQIEMERLNHQAELLLKKATQESDKHTVQDPLSELRLLWDSLEDKIISRQHKLEGALLALGQFQHALDELLAWLTHTEDLLNEQKPVGGDPKAIEIELAKHHVLQNDVFAHQSTVEAVKKAGNDLIESSAVEEASNLRSKLELLNQRWQNLLEKTEQRKQQLDSALIQAQGFHGEVEDLQQWLTDTERQLLASKPVGGLPETAREQLNAHMELCAAFEAKEETYKGLMQKGQQMLARCPESAETNVEQDINNLKEKWESVQTKLSERKTKLEEALNLAMEFHNSLQDFINWLTQAEQTLTAASRPSLILDTVLFQIDEHKVFATEVNSHRDQVIELDKTGTHLKYFSQKQDVVLIKNLLISVQSRWEKVVQRLVERGRALDDARKRAKQFHEAWHKLMEWLEESEKSLDSDLEIANDPDKIKMQLAQHKEFQKSLGAKHSVYDTTNRTGRSLKEKTTLADDNLKLDDMLSELRDKWDTICGKSVERQNKLEEALLFSGQFTDALQALIDWLYKIEPQLAEDQPVHGDIDLVMNLIDNHKVFQKELGKRTSSVQALKRSARELIEGSRDDSSWVKVQMQELSTRWETVCALSVSKQTRLEQALRQAEEFHSVVHVLLEWLAEAEQALRFHGILPDDEEALRTLIEQHREFMKKLEEKKAELNKATGMGEAILAICHPDSITTIKHWITIIRARFEEVLAWAKQHQQRLAGALAGLIANQELLEALLSWLQWAETTLTEKDKEVIPQEIEEVKALIAEHQTFMEEMTRKQPDVDKVTKTYKRKALEPSPVQSHIPVLDKGRAGRKRSPTPGIYPSAAQAQIETKNPRVNLLVSKWQQVWLLALERRRKLNDALDRLEELREFANFDFDIWRKKYMRWMNHKKSRVMDFFRRIDKDQDGKITRQEFIDGILSSKFPTSRLEMSAVADIFDRDGDGYIDYYEFVAALHPNKDAYKPLTDADKIEDEVTRQVAKCKCAKRFQVEQIGDNKYRVSLLRISFGDSQQLRLVRILRSTVMVRVGGGWMALDEFLVKNDPCRVHHHGSKMLRSESNSSITTQPTIAKGRTNVELREKFILADGASQSMAAFRPRGRRSRPSSRGASPNRSTSLSSQAGQAAAPQAVATSTPKTSHHLTRNYGKPWLTNSKTSTPSKPPESSDYQGSSAEGTPIQGSKLRLPGYLSGKGFHSGEDSGILSTAATRVRAQFADTRRTPSRPGSRAGSKAGSRSSSRRGSDASDFDISEIQSVCSDMSETVPATSRPTPRAGSRPGSAKPSKIPTPQRRPLASKSDKSLKR